jgi:hypothetical protein
MSHGAFASRRDGCETLRSEHLCSEAPAVCRAINYRTLEHTPTDTVNAIGQHG